MVNCEVDLHLKNNSRSVKEEITERVECVRRGLGEGRLGGARSGSAEGRSL